MVIRTTVTFDDDDGELLQAWADYDVRSLASLVSAIVIATLRERPLTMPEQVKSVKNVSPSKRVLAKLASGERLEEKDVEDVVRDLGVDRKQFNDFLLRISLD